MSGIVPRRAGFLLHHQVLGVAVEEGALRFAALPALADAQDAGEEDDEE